MLTQFEFQYDRLAHLLAKVSESNSFYRSKWQTAGVIPQAVRNAGDFRTLPFTTKTELVADQAAHPPYGTNLTSRFESYIRCHQSSGTTTGQPMRWLDSLAGWNWVVELWRSTFPDLGITAKDRCFFPFSFGPFLGFWSAFDAAHRLGAFCLSGGGMTSPARLKNILDHRITVVFATPTYAHHLGELAASEGVDLKNSTVHTIVVAGEPGGNIPATKARIEELWGARCLDHYGMTEVGPCAFEMRNDKGYLTIIEKEIVAELIDPNGNQPVPPGEVGELVVTNIGRIDSPLIRYRTGDLFRLATNRPSHTKGWARLEGGCLGRADDMLHVRGNNLYPAAIEAVVRRFPNVAEFRIVVERVASLADLTIEVEPRQNVDSSTLANDVANALRNELLFRIEVVLVPVGTLPRFEMKAKRVVVK